MPPFNIFSHQSRLHTVAMTSAKATPSDAKQAAVKGKGKVKEQKSGVKADLMEKYNSYYLAPTDQQRAAWKGFAELDSGCNLWRNIFQKLQIQGLDLIDVLTWSDYPEQCGKFQPPVYGIIFCFPYDEQEKDKDCEPCPEHVWFSNQLNNNSCGTIALLNIVNNIPDIDLGPELSVLKERTLSMLPTDRGYEVSACDFVRAAHNSFALKIEMLDSDLFLKTEYDAKSSKKRKRRAGFNIGPATKKLKSKDGKMDLANKAFHYVAYVPIDNEIWRLDGLNTGPRKVGSFKDEDWMEILKPTLKKVMDDSPAPIFNIMAVVPDNYSEQLHQHLAESIKALNTVDAHLDESSPIWKTFVTPEDNSRAMTGPSDFPEITADMIKQAQLPLVALELLGMDFGGTIEGRSTIVSNQAQYVQSILDDAEERDKAERRARERDTDYGPLIHAWLGMLAENKTLKDAAEAVASAAVASAKAKAK